MTDTAALADRLKAVLATFPPERILTAMERDGLKLCGSTGLPIVQLREARAALADAPVPPATPRPDTHNHEQGAPLVDDCDGWCRGKYEHWQKSVAVPPATEEETARLNDAILKLARQRREEIVTCVTEHGPLAIHAALFAFGKDVLALAAPVPALREQHCVCPKCGVVEPCQVHNPGQSFTPEGT